MGSVVLMLWIGDMDELRELSFNFDLLSGFRPAAIHWCTASHQVVHMNFK